MLSILEFLFTLAIEIANAMKFKKAKTRTRAMTVIFVLFFGLVTAVPSTGAIEFLRQGEVIGAAVMGVIALAAAAVGLVIVIRGHKNNWKKY